MNDRFMVRYWCKDSKKYLDSQKLVYNDGTYTQVGTKQSSNGTYHSYIMCDWNTSELIPEQCTGLKDKNGKLIYEGDILDVPFENFDGKSFDMRNLLCVVVYFNGSFMFRDKVGIYRYFDETEFAILDKELFAAEVIGNIHENEELLK